MSRKPVDPWFKFFPREWLDGTRELTLEQRGAYIDTIAMRMLHGGPLPDDYSWLGHQMHVSPRKARAIVESLLDAMKLQRVADGITNQRCEEELAARENQRRVNTATAVDRERKRRENTVKLPRNVREIPAKDLSNQVEKLKNINNFNEGRAFSCIESSTTRARLDIDTDIDNTPLPPKGGPDHVAEKFSEFWSLFPGYAPPRGRKTDKPKAEEAFRKIVTGSHRKGLRATAGEIIAGAKRYAQSNPDPEYIPMPTTWLNGGRWADGVDEGEHATLVGPNGKAWGWWRGLEDKLRGLSADYWRQALDEHRPNGTWPWWIFGAPPGHDECVMPEEIISERGYLETYRGQIHHV